MGLIMFGYAIIWIVFAVVTIASKFPKITFSMAWWGFTFPLGSISFRSLACVHDFPLVFSSVIYFLPIPPNFCPNFGEVLLVSDSPFFFQISFMPPPLHLNPCFVRSIDNRNIRITLHPIRKRTTPTILQHPRNNNNHLCNPIMDSRRFPNFHRSMEGGNFLCPLFR